MHHLETLIKAIPPAVFAAGSAGPSSPMAQTSMDPASSPTATFLHLPPGVPPPSLHVFPLMNPSTHFTHDPKLEERQQSPQASFGSFFSSPYNLQCHNPDQLAEATSRMSLTASYLYFDDEGCTRWQGETSGLPVLDLLVERHTTPSNRTNVDPRSHTESAPSNPNISSDKIASASDSNWFPNRSLRRTDTNPQTLWKLITSYIVPELMDR